MPSPSLFHLFWLAPCLALLAWAERQWPSAALAVFMVLTLSFGFAHGAMDIFLLRDARGQLNMRLCGAYALAVVGLGAAFAASPAAALVLLIALSLWHFGEQADFEHSVAKEAMLLRMVQGGASVMLPALLSPDALLPWVKGIAREDAVWVWPIWVGAAALWCALLLAACVVIKPWREGARKTMWWELLALAMLNLLLSPLLAFALFFGLYHSGTHIWRMRRLQRRLGQPWVDGLLAATMLATWAGLAALLWWMSDVISAQDAGLWLRWVIVALAAVTLPHLLLISRHRQPLFGA